MKKIILIGDFNEDDQILKACLQLLFPECHIEVLNGHGEGLVIPEKYSANGDRTIRAAANPVENTKPPVPNTKFCCQNSDRK